MTTILNHVIQKFLDEHLNEAYELGVAVETVAPAEGAPPHSVRLSITATPRGEASNEIEPMPNPESNGSPAPPAPAPETDTGVRWDGSR
ncbi:MAG: hypothetical protein ABR575_00215 [Actinomycetota bacterium]